MKILTIFRPNLIVQFCVIWCGVPCILCSIRRNLKLKKTVRVMMDLNELDQQKTTPQNDLNEFDYNSCCTINGLEFSG